MTTDRPFVIDDNNDAAAAALAAADAWTSALASSPPPPPSADASSLLRRLGISKLVLEQWKISNEEASAWFDGRVYALEAFVAEATGFSSLDCGASSVIDIVQNGKQLNGAGGISALFAAQRLLPGPLQRPALLVGAADDWRCSRLWRRKESKKSSSSSSPRPDWDAFASSFPAGQHARMTDGRRNGARPDVRREVEVSEAVRLLKRFDVEKKNKVVVVEDGDGEGAASDTPLPYLKDLQCSQAHPRWFLDDAAPAWASGDEWLGDGAECWTRSEKKEGRQRCRRPPSYRFVYAGPLGASTPWHAGVYGSCAWSANITGWKKWTFLRPADAPLLYSRFGETTAKWLGEDEEELESSSIAFPWLGEARARAVSVLQSPGDVVFVPPAWWHCVENVPEPRTPSSSSGAGAGAISINVNFVAGPVAAAAAWEDSVLREHEEDLRRRSTKILEHQQEENQGEAGRRRQHRRRLAALPPLPPVPARQVDGSTLSSPPAEGIGIGGFLALALGAAEGAACSIKEASKTATAAAAAKLDPLSRVALARAAVSARSARGVILGAAAYVRRAAVFEEEDSESTAAEAVQRFLEGFSLDEIDAAAEMATAAVEAAARLLDVEPQL